MALTYKCGVCGREGDEFPRVLQCGICSVLLCHKHYFYGACENHFNDLVPADREALRAIQDHSRYSSGGVGDFIILFTSVLAPIIAVIVCSVLAPLLVPEPVYWLVTLVIATSAVMAMVWGMYWHITRFKRRREKLHADNVTIEEILRRYRLSPPRGS